jgi:hypothetical protein
MLTPAKIAEICALARSQVGTTEATGRNDGERVEGYIALGTKAAREPGLSWCAAFVLFLHRMCGVDLPGNDWAMRRVSTLYEVARQHGAILAADEQPEAGDLVIWLGRNAHASAGPSGHVEIVVEVQTTNDFDHTETTHLICVGGNVGNAVRLTNHLASDPRITAFVRPARMFGGHP